MNEDALLMQDPQGQGPQGPKSAPSVPITQPPQDARDALKAAVRDDITAQVDPQAGAFRAALKDAIRADVYLKGQEAQGVGEHLKFLGLGAAKSFADGTFHLASLAYRLVGAASTPFDPKLGFKTNAAVLKQLTGSEDPGVMDVLGAIQGYKEASVYDPASGEAKKVSVGEAADRLIQSKLGRAAIVADVAGTLLSFGTGPGAALGKVGVQVAQPLAGVVERTIAKSLARGAGIAEESVKSLVESGRAMEVITKIPELKQAISLYDKVLMAGGRSARDILSIGAGNMAQAYGLLPDDERLDAAKLGLLTAPLAYPIVKIGQEIASRALTLGLRPQELRIVGDAYKKMLDGQLSPFEASKIVDKSVGRARSLGADAVAAAFDGVAFPLIDPNTHKTFNQWWKGDPQAGGDLIAMMLGSMAGTVGHRYGSRFVSAANEVIGGKPIAPSDHHLFRMVAPDLNRINTKIEAEAVKRAAEEVKQGPQGTPDPNWRESPTARERQAAEAVKRGENWREEEVPQPPNLNDRWEGYAKTARDTSEDPFTEHMRRQEADLKTVWSWADHLTLGVMRATHTEPTLNGDGSVGFNFSPDFGFTLKSEAGNPIVEFDPSRVLPVMADAGRPFRDYDATAPTKAVATGEAARRFMDDITLVQMMRSMQGDLDFSRIGLETIDGRPDYWQSPAGGGVYYQRQMDGSTVEIDKLGGDTGRRPDFVVADGFGEPRHPARQSADILTTALQHKHAVSPDPVVDGIIGRAIMLSQYSNSRGADQLRSFFSQIDGAGSSGELVAMMNPREDQILAFELGSLAVGNNNAVFALRELQRLRDAERGRQQEREAMIAEDLATELNRDRTPTEPTPEEKTDLVRTQIESNEHTIVHRSGEDPRYPDEGTYQKPTPAKEKDRFNVEAPPGMEGFGEGVFPENKYTRGRDPDAVSNFGNEHYHIPDRLEPGGDVAYMMSGVDLVKAAKDLTPILKKAGRKIERYFKALTERQPELLRGRGDDAFVDEIRRVNAQKGDNIGDEQILSRQAKKAMRSQSQEFKTRIVDTEGGPMPLFQAVAEGRKFDIGREITAGEKAAAAAFRAPLELTREMAREAGGVRDVYDPKTGNTLPEPISKTSRFRTPRIAGDDYAEVMNNQPQRMRLWQEVIDKNGLTQRDPGTGNERPMKPEELDTIMIAQAKAASVDVPGRQAAVEIPRQFEWFPSVFEGKKILETSHEELLRRIPRQQAGRAASLAQWGPDVTAEGREHLKANYPEWAAKHLTEGRPGVQARLEKAVEAFVKNAPSGEGPQAAQIARNIISDIEGRIPKDWQLHGWLGEVGRAVHAIDQPIRGAVTSLSFTADPGDLVANHGILYSRPLKTLKLLADTLIHPVNTARGLRDAVIEARRHGLIIDAMGQNDILEARSFKMRWVDAVQWLGTKIENAKIAMHTRNANDMLADWGNGLVTSNDRRVVADFLRFSSADQQALLSGKADSKLQSAFRREYVQFAVSRRPIGEGSAFSAHPGVRANLRFTNWATGNLFKVARIYRYVMQDIGVGAKDLNMRQFASGVGQGLRATGLFTAAGLISKLLSYSIAGVLRGEGADGWDRFWREMGAGVSDPAVGAKVLLNTFGTQVLGGPAAFMLNAFSRGDDPGFWAKMTTPGALWYALQKTLSQENPVTHPIEFAKTLALESGYIPFGNHLRQSIFASAALAGADPKTREIMRKSWEWSALQGLPREKFVRTKPDEFYDALANIRHAIEKHPDDIGEAIRQSEGDLRTALGLAGEESVAAALRGYQFMSHVPKERVDSFSDYIGERGMNYVYAHDQALREFARVIGFAHGEEPTPFDRELDTAERQARLGGGSLWRGLADRVLDDAETDLAAGNGIGPEVRQLAESMAAFPEQQEWLSEQQRKSLARSSRPYSSRVRMLEGILRERARERAASRKKTVRKLRRKGIELPR